MVAIERVVKVIDVSDRREAMTIIRNEDPNELLGFELDPWPPLSDEEIEERERQAEFQDFLDSIPDAAERNRNLK